jgi:hypothetical protein
MGRKKETRAWILLDPLYTLAESHEVIILRQRHAIKKTKYFDQ